MNLKIKYRESFRPFAPAVLAEDAGNYFDICEKSPYMLMVAPVTDSIRSPSLQEDGPQRGLGSHQQCALAIAGGDPCRPVGPGADGD